MEFEFEAVKIVKLEEEHRWSTLVVGDEGFQWRTQKHKKEIGREESKRKKGGRR